MSSAVLIKKEKRKIPALLNQMNECKYRISSLFPLCPTPLHSVLLSKCNQQCGLGAMSVTKTNGSLQILQARRTRPLWGRRVKGTRCPLPTSPLPGFPPSDCFFWDCRTADIKFPDFSIFKECPLTLMTMQRRAQCCSGQTLILTPSDHCRELCGEEEEQDQGTRFIYILKSTLAHRTQGQCETILWHVKSSLPLCSLFSPPLISMSVSPLLPCLFCVFPPRLHFEPDSINLSGKLQMFWVNYINHGEIKLQKAWSSRFIS